MVRVTVRLLDLLNIEANALEREREVGTMRSTTGVSKEMSVKWYFSQEHREYSFTGEFQRQETEKCIDLH